MAFSAVTDEHRLGGFWRRLAATERVAVAAVARYRRYRSGARLLSAGEQGGWAAVLHRGRVRIVDDGRVLGTRCAGDIIGEHALVDDGKRPRTVVAHTPIQALVIGREDFNRVVDRHPHVLWVVSSIALERLPDPGTATDDAFTKVVRFLVREAEGARTAAVRFSSQEELARMLAVSRASVVRAMSSLRAAGIVETGKGGVTVRDVAALRARCGLV
ncbi:Crp/Fnr family transcriptional regulator [Saccharothrix violaceirubra]|uniref:CRP-like cAMP-binding protein n=1 Tax=Saccharothrix violaceirubra TaxID=413306 RepID=A0A7W7T5Q9_9PSEU|nr:Crp/Fnr family transcriptional regulator [Saccharothrix violaceirubra]MBB4967045.1 CRP-like cAMP-binding protein [Saccharothrix violaceirubra]